MSDDELSQVLVMKLPPSSDAMEDERRCKRHPPGVPSGDGKTGNLSRINHHGKGKANGNQDGRDLLKLERNAFYYDTKRAHSGLADHADLEYPGIILKSSHQRFMFGPVLPACCFGWLAQESTIKHSYI